MENPMKEIRRKAKISQAEIAKAMGMPYSAYREVERGIDRGDVRAEPQMIADVRKAADQIARERVKAIGQVA
jgi:transcriptional regulator with XRE-family HTH domain